MMDLKNGYPYSLIRNGLPYDYPKLEQDLKTDVLIIGAGISGALSAYYLTQAGISCIVVDARTVGLGSTCASTSLLQYELDKPLSQLAKVAGKQQAQRVYWLCSEAIDKIGDIAKKVGFKEFKKKQSLFYAAYKKDTGLVKKEFEARKAAGFDVTLLSAGELEKQFGFTAGAAILSSQGASIDSYLFTHHLLRYATKKGLQVFDRTRINHIHHHPRSIEAITATGHTIHAKKIINASGYEVTGFIDAKIVSLHSTYAIASEQQAQPWLEDTMIWNTADPYLYMRTTADKRIIVGGRDEDFYDPSARDRLLGKKSRQLTSDFKKLFPNLEFIPEFSWTGTFGTTKDSMPFIGMYPKIPHTYFALGFGGNGITFSLIAAEIIRDLLCNIKNKDAQLFSFERAK